MSDKEVEKPNTKNNPKNQPEPIPKLLRGKMNKDIPEVFNIGGNTSKKHK